MSIDNSVKNAPSATGAPLIGPSFARRAGNYLGRNGLIVGFILIVIVLSLSTPAFMKLSNLINIIRQVSVNGILAVGETFVILLGGIDLSVGSGVALAGVLAAGLQRYGLPMWVVMPAVFVVPILVLSFAGFINGLVITRFRVPRLRDHSGHVDYPARLHLPVHRGQVHLQLAELVPLAGAG